MKQITIVIRILLLLILVSTGIIQSACSDSTIDEKKKPLNTNEQDLAGILKKGKLVVLAENSSTSFFIYKGKKMGFDEGTSLLLVKQTMQGAYHLINNAELDLDALIKAVASKGGTTEAAIKVFNENGMDSAIVKGVLAAEKRAKELSR